MGLSQTYLKSQSRIRANKAQFHPNTFVLYTNALDKNIEIGTATQKDKNIETARAQFYATRPKLTDYDKAVLALKSDLKNKGYKLSDKQLDALMGTGAKVPKRKEELTLTLGSRSARRVSPHSSTSSTSSSSLKLGY